MTIAALILLGLCFGSFVNALVWRVHEQAEGKASKKLSILHGRSMCPDCRHELAARDLVPVFSWLALRAKCRYCHQSIAWQYPLVEVFTAGLFVASYLWWPAAFTVPQIVIFVLWLALLIGFMALIVYDLRWMLLPNRLIYPLMGLASLQAVVRIASDTRPLHTLLNEAAAVIIGGGIFYLLYQVSNGKWIGGGDVRLGWLLGLTASTPQNGVLFIFLGALSGSLVSVPLLASHKLKKNSVIPFGPFLILGAVVVQLFGGDIWTWYHRLMFMQ
jgi:prepilin signal peptidase PulO-like enzyme (type II secretory pathway)